MPSAADDPRGPAADRPRLSSAADPEILRARLDAAQDNAPARKRLATRADRNLADGHPSSPRDENGNLRPAELSTAEVEILIPPLTDAEWADHITNVANRLDRAGWAGLNTEQLHTIDAEHSIWTDERTGHHDQILDDLYAGAGDVPCDGLAILAGGLGGAGKTTVLDQCAGIDRSQYLTINPDRFKEELAARGLLPDLAGLSPMEASALAHKESSYLARRLAARAMAEGKNVIWDITMSSVESTIGRIEELRTAGYGRVEGVFVDIPIEVSVARAEARHRHGHDDYLAGGGLGGRYLPAAVIRAQFDAHYGSVNRRAFELAKDYVDAWSIYDNSVDGRDPLIVARSS